MGQIMKLSCLLLYAASAVFFSPATCENGAKKAKKSRLMMEYDWPEPAKNLKRLPHPESCQNFYIVKADGSYFMKNCPGNEIFDYRSLRCKEKPLAKCWKDIIEKGKLKKLKRSFSCPFPWGLYPDVEDCSQFFECLGGIHYLRKCPASSVFDKAERTCVPTEKALCADESDVVEPGYKCPYKWGYYAHSSDCSKYYECLRKVPNIRTCGKNLLFDNFRRNCFPMQEVTCGKRMNPYEKVTRLPTEEIKEESSSNTPELATSESTPKNDDNAHASSPIIDSKESRQSSKTQLATPLANDSTKLGEIVAKNLATKYDVTPEATKQVVNMTAGNKILVETVSPKLDTKAEGNTTGLDRNLMENNVTHNDEIISQNSSKSDKSDEKVTAANIPANKTSQEIITTERDKVSENIRKDDKAAVENVRVSSDKTSLTNTEAKVAKTA